MAERVGSLIINLGLESGAFSSGLTNAQKQLKAATKRMEQMGQSVADLGQKLSIGVTAPLLAFSAKAVQGFVAQEQAMGQVNAALKSMGDASGKTAGELAKAADALEMNSLIDAEVILQQVTAQLLTFGNVAGREFDRAQQAAVDMATRLGGEPQAAAIMLGKALNDPIKGLTALTKAGVQFTAAQKAQIEAMVAVGDMAGAQGIILGEVEKQFGGAAKAAADTSPWRKAQVALGQAGDAIGAQLLPMIKPVTDALVRLLSAFNQLSPGMQQGVVIFGALAAALGPVMMGIGGLMQVIAPFTGALSLIAGQGGLLLALKAGFAGLMAVLAPVAVPLAAIAAAGALIWANWDKVAPVLERVKTALIETLGPSIGELVSAISDALTKLWQGPLGDMVRAAWPILKQLGAIAVEVFANALGGTIEAAAVIIGAAFNAIAGGIRVITGLFDGTLKRVALFAVQALYQGVKTYLMDKLDQVWKWVVDKITWVKDAFFGLYDAVVGHSYVPDMVDEIGIEMRRLDAEMVKPVERATSKAAKAFRDLQQDVSGILARLFPDQAAMLGAAADFATLERAFQSKIINRDTFNAAADALSNQRQRGDAPPAAAIMAWSNPESLHSIEGINDALGKLTFTAQDNAAQVTAANVRIEKSFKDMADETLNALDRMASAVKGGGFLDILGAVIGLGLQLGSLGLFGKGFQANLNRSAVPGFANGTSFAPGGLALVGERGPELVNLPRGSQVIPNHALGRANSTHVTFGVDPRTGNIIPFVDGRIADAAPGIAAAGARGGQARMMHSQRRRVY